MALFSKIPGLGKDLVRQKEQRQERRYVPGRSFSLMATIEVKGEPRNARILDMSPGGVGLQVAGPPYSSGDEAKLHLMIEDKWMEFSCRIAHLKKLAVGCRLGLAAHFESPETERNYLQLLHPVMLGSTMRPEPPEEIVQDDPTLYQLAYSGAADTRLSIWRQHDATGEPSHFVWQLG
ncbi:MAG TPA: PilZ domain-containing protein, partial [Phycisphaerae bacterium]|nr:PilZ domain-containing protein [Phycisphaerae bacterium]